MDSASLRRTPLYPLHLELGAKMVPFAGYEMPLQYEQGILKEHLHCRAGAGLFDVSHMGQIALRPFPASARTPRGRWRRWSPSMSSACPKAGNDTRSSPTRPAASWMT